MTYLFKANGLPLSVGNTKKNKLEIVYIYIGVAFIIGFVIAWFLQTANLIKIKKDLKSAQGYLESEMLKKETLQKEIAQLLQLKATSQMDYEKKLEHAFRITKMMDNDILLLQKSNEETEALLREGQPAMHALKLQLIEANNTIARYKAQQQAGKTA